MIFLNLDFKMSKITTDQIQYSKMMLQLVTYSDKLSIFLKKSHFPKYETELMYIFHICLDVTSKYVVSFLVTFFKLLQIATFIFMTTTSFLSIKQIN